MSFAYDNTGTAMNAFDETIPATYSEVQRTWASPQDLTQGGYNALVLSVQGNSGNATAPLYVVLESAGQSAVIYHNNPDIVLLTDGWNEWAIKLDSITAVDLTAVTKMVIGVGDASAAGGSGTLLVDRIVLANHVFVEPVEPDSAALVGHWTFDDGSGTTAADSSVNGNHGAITGAEWVAGKLGGALSFNGEDYVTVPPEAFSSIETQVTIAFWAYGDPNIQPQADCCFSAVQDVADAQTRVVQCNLPWSNGTVFWDTGGVGYDRIQKAASPEEYEGSWQHWTFTKNADTGEQSIYHNGALWHSGTGFSLPMTGVTAFLIGSQANGTENNYDGMMDDFRLYDRALTPEEIGWLAGWTEPF